MFYSYQVCFPKIHVEENDDREYIIQYFVNRCAMCNRIDAIYEKEQSQSLEEFNNAVSTGNIIVTIQSNE